jgi:transcriptional regulator with XRE-family HTH domain
VTRSPTLQANAAQGASELKQRFRKAREHAGFTLRELATKSGQPLSTITDIEGGRRMPRINTLEKIAQALHVSSGWLAYGDGIQPDWYAKSEPKPEAR